MYNDKIWTMGPFLLPVRYKGFIQMGNKMKSCFNLISPFVHTSS